MKGLLIKDVCTLVRQMKLFLVMILVFAVLPSDSSFNPMSTLALAYASLLSITTLAYDERAKWDRLAAMLPYSPLELVLSKYIISWVSVLCAFVLTAAVQSVPALARGSFSAAGVLAPLGLSLGTALLLPALSMPLVFRFGVERGRIGFLVLMALFAAGGAVLANHALPLPGFNLPAVTLALLAAAAAANVVSVRLAARLYKKHRA